MESSTKLLLGDCHCGYFLNNKHFSWRTFGKFYWLKFPCEYCPLKILVKLRLIFSATYCNLFPYVLNSISFQYFSILFLVILSSYCSSVSSLPSIGGFLSSPNQTPLLILFHVNCLFASSFSTQKCLDFLKLFPKFWWDIILGSSC